MENLTLEQMKEKLSIFEPIRIGLMGWSGPDPIDPAWQQAPARAMVMAIEEGIAAGMVTRNVEFVSTSEANLPQGTWKGTIDAYDYLVDAGCALVVGSHSQDNLVTHLEHMERMDASGVRQPVPVISWSAGGANKWLFRLGNGECGSEVSILCNWVKKHGYSRIGVVIEGVNPEHEDAYRSLVYETRKLGIRIVALEYIPHVPVNVVESVRRVKDADPEVFMFLGCGMNFMQRHISAALKELDWEPEAKLASSSFMYYPIDTPSFEGWVGVDQMCLDNPLFYEFRQRYFDRYHEELGLEAVDSGWCDGLFCLSYDTGQVIREAIMRAPSLTPEGLRQGIERIRWVPALTGGPGNFLCAYPGEHNLFNGEYLVLGRVRDGKLEYEGKFDAQTFDVPALPGPNTRKWV